MYRFFFFQAEDGIRDLVRSRGLGDVYKRQDIDILKNPMDLRKILGYLPQDFGVYPKMSAEDLFCLLYTSDAADERSSVDLGGRRIIKKKKDTDHGWGPVAKNNNTLV